MIKRIKENKGFTLAELLIVIAIIAILIAIAVPVFSSSMQRANEATDCANIRALKAAAVAWYLDDQAKATPTFTTGTKMLTLYSDGQARDSAPTGGSAVVFKLDSTKNTQLGTLGVTGTWSRGANVTCTLKADGEVTFP